MAIDRFLIIVTLLFVLLQDRVNAQETRLAISMKNIDIHSVIKIGTYDELVQCLGVPSIRFDSSLKLVNPKFAKDHPDIPPKQTIACEHLVYDAYEYILVGDSVQLIFIDVKKSEHPIYIDNIHLTNKMTQKEFLSIMESRSYWLKSDYECWVGSIEGHYCTYTPVKNYYFDFKEDPYDHITITFKDKKHWWQNNRIWWIEIPVMKIGGIVH